MESCTRYIEGKRFETFLGRHRIVSDQRTEDGGSDSGPTPPELLLASLGSCAGHYAAEYLRARSLPITGLRVTVSADKGGRPARMGPFRIEVEVAGLDLGIGQREGLARSVKACLIHNTLTAHPVIEVEILRGSKEPGSPGCVPLAGLASLKGD